ncbi:hypothetical protein [Cupriavidus alkaliphilus]|uniref:hypothetical protein n=1 Tax=Cupriavidus alkaliphilus TaxID=942866 RepID=UPI0016152176|nr:hypothetical protein [Cupriavidus alkaliphilus]MBB3014084.1 hypothetical protein [Cupriavidus alkaliphilus]
MIVDPGVADAILKKGSIRPLAMTLASQMTVDGHRADHGGGGRAGLQVHVVAGLLRFRGYAQAQRVSPGLQPAVPGRAFNKEQIAIWERLVSIASLQRQ